MVVDVDNRGAATINYPPVRRGGRFAVALGTGAVGYSFGAGAGIAFARGGGPRPCQRTAVIAGDGMPT